MPPPAPRNPVPFQLSSKVHPSPAPLSSPCRPGDQPMACRIQGVTASRGERGERHRNRSGGARAAGQQSERSRSQLYAGGRGPPGSRERSRAALNLKAVTLKSSVAVCSGRVEPPTAEETDPAPCGDRSTRATWDSGGHISLQALSGWVWTSAVGACERAAAHDSKRPSFRRCNKRPRRAGPISPLGAMSTSSRTVSRIS